VDPRNVDGPCAEPIDEHPRRVTRKRIFPMRLHEAFPSRYLKAVDFGGKSKRFVVDRLGHEKMRDGTEKLVLYFRNEEQALVLNKTNFESIESLHGDSNDWPGCEIILRPDQTNFGGKRVAFIRVSRFPQQTAKPTATKPTIYDSEDPGDFDDFEAA
jgi:hypothetical protein